MDRSDHFYFFLLKKVININNFYYTVFSYCCYIMIDNRINLNQNILLMVNIIKIIMNFYVKNFNYFHYYIVNVHYYSKYYHCIYYIMMNFYFKKYFIMEDYYHSINYFMMNFNY